MFKILNVALRSRLSSVQNQKKFVRTFLSQAYYCNEIWDERLNSPILQKINLDILYHELDQRFQKTRRMSPVDVDIFANAVKDDNFIDEVLDLMHKLRLTPDTGKTLNSTGHAVIRSLVNNNRNSELLQALDDRINYGLFLDDYTANILMDKFWKSKNFVAGSIVASQMMLQEELSHPVTVNFALLHCYNYLIAPGEWPQPPTPEEPEEEVKVRVKYIRNPYDDDHFDLRDPKKIIGKILSMAARNKDVPIYKSLEILGLILYAKEDLAKKAIDSSLKDNVKLVKEVIDLVPEDLAIKQELAALDLISEDVHDFLTKQVAASVAQTSEKDIANQCALYKRWENERIQALEEQKKILLTAERLAEIEKLKQSLKEREQKLWFFENEEKIELTIEETETTIPKETVTKQAAEQEYVPPEITRQKPT